MTTYLRNPLTLVWALLAAITIASWSVGRGHGGGYEINATVTAIVLILAAVKAQLVIRYFMEVRAAPAWLKATAYGWVAGLFLVLLAAYRATL